MDSPIFGQYVFFLSVFVFFSSADLQELYEELAVYLRQEKRYRDAAKILLTYMKQHEDAVSVLCEGKLWREAMSVAQLLKRLDLIGTFHDGFLIFFLVVVSLVFEFSSQCIKKLDYYLRKIKKLHRIIQIPKKFITISARSEISDAPRRENFETYVMARGEYCSICK